MNATRLIVASFLISAPLQFDRSVYAGDATKFSTVQKMIEEFGEYSEEGRTFRVISEHPLHIQISPVVATGTSPRIIESMVHMAAVETVYRAFIHTAVDKLTVTALPKTLVVDDGTAGDLLTDHRVSLTVTRKRALALLNRYFPGKSFEDLVVTTKDMGGDMRSKLFCRLTYPDQGSPGVEVVFVDLAQTDR